MVPETSSQKRPWLAVLLAALYPGLGHVYLREWFRAILWFGLIMTASIVLVPSSIAPEMISVTAFMDAASKIPMDAKIAVLSLTLLSVVDAYSLAKRANRARAQPSEDGTMTCPECGRELDPDLDFCHWCSAELQTPEETDETSDQRFDFGFR